MENDFEYEGTLDEAIAFLEKAKEAEAHSYLPYLNLGQAYYLKGWLFRAQDELRQGLERAPDNAALKSILASVERSLN